MKNILFLILLFPIDINSCTCINEGTTLSSIREADAVFVGRVLSVCEFRYFDEKYRDLFEKFKKMRILSLKEKGLDSVSIYNRMSNYEQENLLVKHYFQYDFLVEKKYKGYFYSDTIRVISLDEEICGFSFVVGEKYIVYAYCRDSYTQNGTLVEPFLETDRCTRTAIENKDHIDEIEKALRKKKKSKKR